MFLVGRLNRAGRFPSPRASSTGAVQEGHMEFQPVSRSVHGGPTGATKKRDWPKERSVSLSRRVQEQSIERENLGIVHRSAALALWIAVPKLGYRRVGHVSPL